MQGLHDHASFGEGVTSFNGWCVGFLGRGQDIQLSRDRYRPLEERWTQINSEIPRLQGELNCLKVNRVSTDEVLAEATTFAAHWPDMNQDERRKIVENS